MDFERIHHNEVLIAIIVRKNYHQESVSFFTPHHFPLQLGYMSHPEGYEITPHIHQKIPREICDTQEVLFIKSGKIRVDFYSDKKEYLESRELNSGDIILLASEGHGFTLLEPSTMIEIKAGPYLGNEDKTRFKYERKKSYTC